MAAVDWFEARSCWRVNYVVTVGSRKVRRAKYAKAKEEATALATQLGQVEQATRTGIAIRQSIEEWITRG